MQALKENAKWVSGTLLDEKTQQPTLFYISLKSIPSIVS